MSDNRTAFRYFATNVGVKALSFYFVPSVLFKLTFYDTKAHIYMFWAIFLFLTGNLLNHIFNGLKYSGNSKKLVLLRDYAIGMGLSLLVYLFICFCLGAKLFGDFTGSMILIASLGFLVFLNAYIYSDTFYDALYNCLRLDLEFMNEGNPDRLIQLHTVMSNWGANLGGWFMTTFYPYDWFNTEVMSIYSHIHMPPLREPFGAPLLLMESLLWYSYVYYSEAGILKPYNIPWYTAQLIIAILKLIYKFN